MRRSFVRRLSGLAPVILRGLLEEFSAVGFAAMAHGADRDGVLVSLVQENPVVTTAKTEARTRRFEFLHLASAIRQVAIHAVENLL